MRKVAAHLGAGAMSLYNHVDGRDDLIDAMIDAVAAEWELPDARPDWKQSLRDALTSAHGSLLAHPWAVVLMASHPGMGPARMRFYDAILGTLVGAGFPIALARRGFLALDTQVIGFAVAEVHIPTGSDGPQEAARAFAEHVPASLFPNMTAMMGDLLQTGDYHYPFAATVDLLLDGLERQRADHVRAQTDVLPDPR